MKCVRTFVAGRKGKPLPLISRRWTFAAQEASFLGHVCMNTLCLTEKTEKEVWAPVSAVGTGLSGPRDWWSWVSLKWHARGIWSIYCLVLLCKGNCIPSTVSYTDPSSSNPRRKCYCYCPLQRLEDWDSEANFTQMVRVRLIQDPGRPTLCSLWSLLIGHLGLCSVHPASGWFADWTTVGVSVSPFCGASCILSQLTTLRAIASLLTPGGTIEREASPGFPGLHWWPSPGGLWSGEWGGSGAGGGIHSP